MKLCTTTILLIIAVYSRSTVSQENMDLMMNACMQEIKIDPTLLQKAFIQGEFVNDPKLKCFMKCLFIKMGDMSESGELNIENLKSQGPPNYTQAQVNEIVDGCKSGVPAGVDACEIAYVMAKCMTEKLSKPSPPPST